MDTENLVGKGAIHIKSKNFAVRIIRLVQFLQKEKKEHVLSKQLLKSGTSIGANVSESVYAQSKADFISKMSIALKEAAETEYWIDLLEETEYVKVEQVSDLKSELEEILKLLTSIIKTSKKNS